MSEVVDPYRLQVRDQVSSPLFWDLPDQSISLSLNH